MLLARCLGDRCHRFVDQHADFDTLFEYVDEAGFDLRYVDDVGDQRKQMPRRTIDPLQLIGLPRIQLARHARQHDAREADDRIERRAQFV